MTENTVNILIVSENSELRSAIKNAAHLSQFNASTTLTDNIMVALKECRYNRFDSIFLDRHLSTNSFVEFMNQLYEIDHRAAVCMLINEDKPELEEEALYHGALDIIAKDAISIKNVSSFIRQSLDYRTKKA